MLQNLFRQVRQLPAVIDAMTPPAQAPVRSWRSYRAAFLNEARLSAGDQSLQRHREVLARARSQYGVPEEVIAAILGVETIYGRNTGNWRVIDALATMALGSANGMPPGSLPRAEFFRDELASFLMFARDQQLDALSVRGSYAGAFGIPQFMPGSWRRWGIDFDGDGRADLRASHADAIGSVANFLASHGWERDAPIGFDAQLQGEAWRTLIDGTVKPVQSLATLAAAGARIAPLGGEPLPQPDPALDPARLGILIELRSSDADPAYRIGLHNFWVITRYNRSSFYASAVLDFALALRARR
jgi:membrane-bound lytic murein transglycosylase B